MSTVRNDRYDEISKIREHYKEREEELKAQHAKEKKTLSKNYEESLSKIDRQTHEVDSDRREQLRTAITKSDKKHTDDIEKIKKVHSKQVRAERERMSSKEKDNRAAYKVEEERMKNLYDSKMKERDRAHSKALSSLSQERQESLAEYQDRHKEELTHLKKDYQRKFEEERQQNMKLRTSDQSDVENEYADYRTDKEKVISSMEKKHRNELQRQQRAYERMLDEKDRTNQNILNRMREESMDGVEREKRQYYKASKEHEAALQASWDSLEGQNDEQVDHLNHKIRKLEEKNIFDRDKVQRQKKREIENVKIAYQDNVESLLDQRKSMVNQNNELRYEQVAEANERADRRIDEAYSYYKQKMQNESDHHDADVARVQRKMGLQSKQEQMMTDYRFKKLSHDYAKDRALTVRQHQKSMQALKSEMAKTIDAERVDRIRERNKIQEHFQNRIAESEVRHMEDLDRMKVTHDKQIAEVRSHYENQIKDTTQVKDMEIAEAKQSQEIAAQNQQAAYDYRMKKMEEAYQANLKRFDTRREQSIRTLSDRREARSKLS